MRRWIAIVVTLLASRSLAQGIRVDAMLADDRPYVGSPVRYTIVVTGSHSAVGPDLAEIPGVRSRYDGVDRESFLANVEVDGRLEKRLVRRLFINYSITAEVPGGHTIPPVELTVGGEPYRTQPITFVARRAQASEDTRLILDTPRTRVYVGEPVPIRLSWYTDTARNASISGPMGGERADLYASTRPRWAVEDGAQSVRVEFLNRDLRAGLSESAIHDGVVYDRVVNLDIILIPTKEGRMDLGPMTVEYPRLSTRGFRSPLRMELARSNSLILDVLPVPAQSPASTFTGLVGVASISAQGGPSEVKVGDPIRLEMTILTGEPAARVQPPQLDVQSEPWSSFQLDPGGWEETGSTATTRTFQTTIRAREESITEIPSIEFAFFDPRTERFATAETSPIPLAVSPTRTITTAESIGAIPPGVDAEPLTLRDLHAGVLDNATGPSLLVDESASALAFLRSPVGIGAIAVPPVAYVATALLLAVRRRTRSAAHRRRRALSRASAALSSAGSECERVRGAIRVYIGARFGRDADTITPKDCHDLLAQDAGVPSDGSCEERIGEQIGARLASLLTQAEREQFDVVADPTPPPIDRARELLQQADSAGDRA